MHEGGDRDIRGRREQALADGGAGDFPLKCPLPPALQRAPGSEQTEAFDPEVIGEGEERQDLGRGA